MKVTGFLLREAIRRWELRRDTAAKQFDEVLTKFPGEEKQSPSVIAEAFSKAEASIASLQAAQNRYNLFVLVDVFETKMTLCEAVKRVGGAGRLDKMWRTAVTGKKDPYGRDNTTRQADTVYAVRVVSPEDAMKRADKAAALAGAFRAAIAKGNCFELDTGEIQIDPALLTE
jgi:hypothetical protein